MRATEVGKVATSVFNSIESTINASLFSIVLIFIVRRSPPTCDCRLTLNIYVCYMLELAVAFSLSLSLSLSLSSSSIQPPISCALCSFYSLHSIFSSSSSSLDVLLLSFSALRLCLHFPHFKPLYLILITDSL